MDRMASHRGGRQRHQQRESRSEDADAISAHVNWMYASSTAVIGKVSPSNETVFLFTFTIRLKLSFSVLDACPIVAVISPRQEKGRSAVSACADRAAIRIRHSNKAWRRSIFAPNGRGRMNNITRPSTHHCKATKPQNCPPVRRHESSGAWPFLAAYRAAYPVRLATRATTHKHLKY
jgi:hypothetical protein